MERAVEKTLTTSEGQSLNPLCGTSKFHSMDIVKLDADARCSTHWRYQKGTQKKTSGWFKTKIVSSWSPLMRGRPRPRRGGDHPRRASDGEGMLSRVTFMLTTSTQSRIIYS